MSVSFSGQESNSKKHVGVAKYVILTHTNPMPISHLHTPTTFHSIPEQSACHRPSTLTNASLAQRRSNRIWGMLCPRANGVLWWLGLGILGWPDSARHCSANRQPHIILISFRAEHDQQKKNMQVSMIEWYLVLFELSNLFPGEFRYFCGIHSSSFRLMSRTTSR